MRFKFKLILSVAHCKSGQHSMFLLHLQPWPLQSQATEVYVAGECHQEILTTTATVWDQQLSISANCSERCPHLRSAIFLILLVDERISHPRDVVADNAGQRFLPRFFAVVA